MARLLLFITAIIVNIYTEVPPRSGVATGTPLFAEAAPDHGPHAGEKYNFMNENVYPSIFRVGPRPR